MELGDLITVGDSPPIIVLRAGHIGGASVWYVLYPNFGEDWYIYDVGQYTMKQHEPAPYVNYRSNEWRVVRVTPDDIGFVHKQFHEGPLRVLSTVRDARG